MEFEKILSSESTSPSIQYFTQCYKDILTLCNNTSYNVTNTGVPFWDNLPVPHQSTVYDNYLIFNGYNVPSDYTKRLLEHFQIPCSAKDMEEWGFASSRERETVINYNPFTSIIQRSIANAEAMKADFKVKTVGGEGYNDRIAFLNNALMQRVSERLASPEYQNISQDEAKLWYDEANKGYVDRRAEIIKKLLGLWSKEIDVDGKFTTSYLDAWLAGYEVFTAIPLRGKMLVRSVPPFLFDYDKRASEEDLSKSTWTYEVCGMSKLDILNYLGEYIKEAKGVKFSDIEALQPDFMISNYLGSSNHISNQQSYRNRNVEKQSIKTEWFFWKAPKYTETKGITTKVYGCVVIAGTYVVPISDYPLQSEAKYGVESISFPYSVMSYSDRNIFSKAPFDYIKPFWELFNFLMYKVEKELAKMHGSIVYINPKDVPTIGDSKMGLMLTLKFAHDKGVMFSTLDPDDPNGTTKLPIKNVNLDDYTSVTRLFDIMARIEQFAYDHVGLPKLSNYDKYMSDSAGEMLQTGVNQHVQHDMVRKHSKFRYQSINHITNCLTHIYANYEVDDYILSTLDFDNLQTFNNFVKNSKFGIEVVEGGEPLPDSGEVIKQLMKHTENLTSQIQKMGVMLQKNAAEQTALQSNKTEENVQQFAYINPEGNTSENQVDTFERAMKLTELKQKDKQHKADLTEKKKRREDDKYIARINKN